MSGASHRLGLLALAIAVASASTCGCGDDRARDAAPPPSAGPIATSGPVPASGGAPAKLPVADPNPPWPGWKRWPHTPEDCSIFVPEDLAQVSPLVWKPCPFQAEGCEWAEEAGCGFGHEIVAVKQGNSQLFAFQRCVHGVESSKDGWGEIVVQRDDEVVAAWRKNVVLRGCATAMPHVGSDGLGATLVVRVHAENEPLAFVEPIEKLMDPGPPQLFGPPDSALLPTGIVHRSPELLVAREHYGPFTVRELATGRTWRPKPNVAFKYLSQSQAVGRSVFYWAWAGGLSTIWRWHVELHQSQGHQQVLLGGAPYSYDAHATDGKHLAWTRSKDQLGINQFETVELWVSPLQSNDLGVLEPKQLATLPVKALTRQSVGEGWVAASLPITWDALLYPVDGGPARRLPPLDGGHWGSNQDESLIISGGRVWVGMYMKPGKVTHLARFEIEKLPLLEPN